MSRSSKQYLERHGGKWRVVIPVPRNLQKKLGKTKLKRGLGTDSLTVANALKWEVISQLNKELRLAVKGTPNDPLLREALTMREAKQLEEATGEPHDFTVDDAIHIRADELAGQPIAEDPDTGDPVYDEERLRQAGYYYKVASGQETPLMALVNQWHTASVNRKERTKGDDLRALGYLEEWCKSNTVHPTIEAITRRVAGRFVGDLPALAKSAKGGSQTLSNRTVNKYLSSLSGYWQWLKKKGMADENVWREQFLPKERRDTEDRERPFHDDEVRKLLTGFPRTRTLGPLMRIAALTGARIDAIVSLRVKDCDNGTFRFKPQKKENGERYIPIHSALVPLITDLTKGKAPDDDLLPGFRVPLLGPSRSVPCLPSRPSFTTGGLPVSTNSAPAGSAVW